MIRFAGFKLWRSIASRLCANCAKNQAIYRSVTTLLMLVVPPAMLKDRCGFSKAYGSNPSASR